MEFLRFGSSIPGSYWGCCAVDIIQNFKVDPDTKASIEMVQGDGGGPCLNNKGVMFAGPTYKEVFLQRLRVGTFGVRDMPNHAFIAVLTDWQVKSGVGVKWLKILKEQGFEFIRSVSNSVYTGATPGKYAKSRGRNQNYIFALVRNIGTGGDGDSFTPPPQWTKLERVVPEVWELLTAEQRADMAAEQHKVQTELWNAIGAPKFMSEAEIVAAGAPVTMAGRRSNMPQQSKAARQQVEGVKAVATSPWQAAPVPPMEIAAPQPATAAKAA